MRRDSIHLVVKFKALGSDELWDASAEIDDSSDVSVIGRRVHDRVHLLGRVPRFPGPHMIWRGECRPSVGLTLRVDGLSVPGYFLVAGSDRLLLDADVIIGGGAAASLKNHLRDLGHLHRPRGCPAYVMEKKMLMAHSSGWFVAYLNGNRVALEQTLDKLFIKLKSKYGSPRPACEIHELVESEPGLAGPRPRLLAGNGEVGPVGKEG